MGIIKNLKSFKEYAKEIMELRYSHVVNGVMEKWEDISKRVVDNVVRPCKLPKDVVDGIYTCIVNRKFIPGGRILSQAGREYHQTDNCFLLRAEDTREGWAELAYKATKMFMSGGGVGVDYSDIRPYGAKLKRSGGIASGPVPLIQMINGIGAAARQGGERRGAIYGSLRWDHEDIHSFIDMKNNGDLKHTNISTRFNRYWYDAISDLSHIKHNLAKEVFQHTLHNACKDGDPGLQYDDDDNILRNACTEIISADDCDSCCLGSVNLANMRDIEEFSCVVELGVLFLLCATMYTDIPHAKVYEVKERNRRLGLGLMGVGEWFIQRHQPYGGFELQGNVGIRGFDRFTDWLDRYKTVADVSARNWSRFLSVNVPIATRAIAPTGTISIVGGHTTPGIEPVFHTAYQRTYNTLKDKCYHSGLKKERVIDPIVAKWIEEGYDVRDIDTAYTLSMTREGIQRRIRFQALCQKYVDNAISSTVNLPQYRDGIEKDVEVVLLEKITELRGITFYPNGRHKDQPVVPIDIKDVLENNNVIMSESESCKNGICGI